MALLLAFGTIPLSVTIGVGYVVARGIIVDQSEGALRELARQQAVHLATELTRQRLILQTITGHLTSDERSGVPDPGVFGALLRQSLPEGGVFDGLRVVTEGGSLLTSVALRNTEPHWPDAVPASDWRREVVTIHWEGRRAVAYVIAVPFGETVDMAWLEGHVRSEDFGRVFSIPEHLIGDVESALLTRSGRLIVASHEHAGYGLGTAFVGGSPDTLTVEEREIGGAASLLVTAPVAETGWLFAAALPLASALAPLAGLRNASVLAAAVLALLIAVTAIFVARSISGPLDQLAGAARRFGRGEGYGAIRSAGALEVRQLIDAFHQMTDGLRASRQEIMQLHEQEMERAQQLATVGELASGIAHEVRNPLTGVLGALDLALQRLPAGDQGRPLLEEAQAQLRRIEATTSQLLRYARPPELRELLIDPNGLLERAAHIVEPHARAARVEIRLEPAPQSTPVRADPELMVQVLVNLMLNGVDAMEPGGVLTVWVTHRPPQVLIGVQDTGAGVSPEVHADIFRPFFTTKSQGTGLGLPISRQIVERHGGQIRLEDTPGGGATFVVALPLANEGGDAS